MPPKKVTSKKSKNAKVNIVDQGDQVNEANQVNEVDEANQDGQGDEVEDQANEVDQGDEADQGEEVDDSMPSLEYVSNAIKERYEYNPVLRNDIVYRKPEDRMTSEVMTRFEYCEVISHRAKQLENGGTSFTDIGELTDPIDIAKKEISDKKCPLSVVRMITDKIAEKWAVNELAIPFD